MKIYEIKLEYYFWVVYYVHKMAAQDLVQNFWYKLEYYSINDCP
jgi:hypothetical protein